MKEKIKSPENKKILNDKKNTSASEEIFTELQKIEREILDIQKLGKNLYTTSKEKPETHEAIFSIIKFHGKDKLINLGEYSSDEELFESKFNPISLFVVDKRNVGDIENANPREFLRNYATKIIQQKGRGAITRSSSEMGSKIDFTHLSIRPYENAIASMRTAILKKIFSSKLKYAQAIELIKRLQKKSFHDLEKTIIRGGKFYDGKMEDFASALEHMGVISGEEQNKHIDTKLIYDIIHSFSIKEEKFIS